MTQLSEHFSYDELTHTDHRQFDNTPNKQELANLVRLAILLEEVKKALGGKPIIVNSAYRSKEVNDAVGSKDTSQHRLGCAADIRVPGMTPRQVIEEILAADIQFDQIILEFNSWTHISIPNDPNGNPRHSKLIIEKTGTRLYV
jgi:hypothetical protein